MTLYNKIKEYLKKGQQSNTSVRSYSELEKDEKARALRETYALKTGSKELNTEYEAEITALYDIFNHTKIRYAQENKIIDNTELKNPNSYIPVPSIDDQLKIIKAKKEIYSLLAAGEYEIIRKEFEDIQANLEVRYNAITRAMSFINNNTPSYGQLLAELEKVKNLFNRVKEILEEVDKEIKSSVKEGSLENSFRVLMERLNKKSQYKNIFLDTLGKIASDPNFRYVEYDDFANDVKLGILSRINRLESRFNDRLMAIIPSFFEKPIDEALKKFVQHDCDGELSEKEAIMAEKKKAIFIRFFQAKHYHYAWEYLIHELSDELLLELFKLLAEYMHIHEKYVYERKDEYKEPLEKAKEAIKEFQSTPMTAWEEFEETPYGHMLSFGGDMYQYTKLCPNYVTPELKEEIAKTYVMLHWLHQGYCYADMGPDSVFYPPTYDYHNSVISSKDTIKYIREFKNDILKKIEEKFGVKLSELKFLKENRSKFISDSYFDVLADILATGKIPKLYLRPTIEHPIRYICGSKHKIFYFDSICEVTTLDVLYHYLRAINNDDIDFDFSDKMPVSRHSDEYSFEYNRPSSMDNFLALIAESVLNKQYDDRILIVSSLTDKPLDIINSNNRIKAVYISDNKKLQELINTPNSLRCIFVPEYFHSAIASDSDYTLPSGTKIIIVPNDVTYSELSDILNQEIAKTEEAKRNIYTEQ